MVLNKEEISVQGYEKVVYAECAEAGLKAIISVHNTNLGPACGGIRMLPYESKEAALQDVLRLSKGMSYKSSLAEINFGGGKSVIICDPKNKSRNLFHAFAAFVDSFEGQYISAQDMNISGDDLKMIKEKTSHVIGIQGEPGSSGDPSPVTARGVFRAIEATAEELNGKKDLHGVKISIQGLGSVGMRLAEMLYKGGAVLQVADINSSAVEKAVKSYNALALSQEQIFTMETDIFSPCARGAILNEKSIPQLKCKAVVGAANNQLAEEKDAERLMQRGILYAPDYAANAGGIINVYVEYEGYDLQKALKKADKIYETMRNIYQRAKREHKTTSAVANLLAEERLYSGTPKRQHS